MIMGNVSKTFSKPCRLNMKCGKPSDNVGTYEPFCTKCIAVTIVTLNYITVVGATAVGITTTTVATTVGTTVLTTTTVA
ncbi:unnamed protein product, partial [Rotaria socialis]